MLLSRSGAPRVFSDLLGAQCPMPFGAAAVAATATAAAASTAAAAAAKVVEPGSSSTVFGAQLQAARAAATAAAAVVVAGMPRPGSLCGKAKRCLGFAAANEEHAAALAASCSMRQLPLVLLPTTPDIAASYLLEAGAERQGLSE